LVVIAPRLYARLVDGGDHDPLGPDVWSDTAVILSDSSDQTYRNEFTGEVISDASGRLNLGDVLGNFPVAALIR
jgi:maltooligosyltrehalose synthase